MKCLLTTLGISSRRITKRSLVWPQQLEVVSGITTTRIITTTRRNNFMQNVFAPQIPGPNIRKLRQYIPVLLCELMKETNFGTEIFYGFIYLLHSFILFIEAKMFCTQDITSHIHSLFFFRLFPNFFSSSCANRFTSSVS